MVAEEIIVIECQNSTCQLRFSIPSTIKLPLWCPRCHSELVQYQKVPNLHEDLKADRMPKSAEIEVLLDNVRSAYNVGSIFRSSDGAGIDKLYLCGITPTPENIKLSKTGLGAEWAIPWEYHPNAYKLINQKKSNGYCIILLESSRDSISIFDPVLSLPTGRKLLIIGNEITGLDPEFETLKDYSLYIPMRGYKRSLNVCVAFGIAAFYLVHQNQRD